MSDYQSILFVEDEDLIRELNAEELAEAGFELVVVESGDDALEALDNDAEPFCALVTDVNLGDGADGWDVGKRARELDDKIPVIYVSGASADEWQTKGVPNGAVVDDPPINGRFRCQTALGTARAGTSVGSPAGASRRSAQQ